MEKLKSLKDLKGVAILPKGEPKVVAKKMSEGERVLLSLSKLQREREEKLAEYKGYSAKMWVARKATQKLNQEVQKFDLLTIEEVEEEIRGVREDLLKEEIFYMGERERVVSENPFLQKKREERVVRVTAAKPVVVQQIKPQKKII